MNWSEQIHSLRQKLLITQTELAKMIGVSYVSINRWENGHFEPTMKAKRALMKLFVENGIAEDE